MDNIGELERNLRGGVVMLRGPEGIQERLRDGRYLRAAAIILSLAFGGCMDDTDGMSDDAETSESGTAAMGMPGTTDTSTSLDGDSSPTASSGEAGDATGANDCSGFQGVVTPEQSAATPRQKVAVEKVAIFFTDEPVVPEDVYERAVADYEMRSENGYTGCPAAEPVRTQIRLAFDGDHRASVGSGDYDDWDCVNELYDATPLVSPGGAQVIIDLGGVFDTEQILPDYAELPGVESADTIATDCRGGEFEPPEAKPGLHGCAEGTTWHYWWTDAHPGQVGFPITAGAHLVSDPGEPPAVTCSWADGQEPCPMPACLELSG